MSSPQEKPAVVICHGSCHTPAPYQPFMDVLNSQGFETHCPQRPMADLSKLNVGDINHPDFDRGPPPEGLPTDHDDLAVVHQLLDKLINQEHKKVLLVAHSSGGWVATQAAIPDLQLKVRQAEGKSGGLIGLFYYASFVIPVGESISTFTQPKDGSSTPPPWMRFWKAGRAGVLTFAEPKKYLFNDLDEAEAEKWIPTLTASPIQTGVLTNDPYGVLPCAYLVLDEDLMVLREHQEGMIALQGSNGNAFTVYHAPAGHSAHLSWTGGLAGTVGQFVRDILEV